VLYPEAGCYNNVLVFNVSACNSNMHSRCLFDQATPMVCVWSHMMHPTEFL